MEVTAEALCKLCKSHGYYSSPELNERLHVVAKGFTRIHENAMVEFTNVSACWLTDNALESLEGLQHLIALRSLWCQRNFLLSLSTHILGGMQFLESVDLSENQLTKLERGCLPPTVTTVIIQRNRFINGLEDIWPGLENLTELRVLDCAHNRLEEGPSTEAFVFTKLPKSVAILNFQGNPFRETIRGYHRQIKEAYPKISCIDDVKVMD